MIPHISGFILYILLGLAYVTEHNVSRFTHVTACIRFSLFDGWIILHCMYSCMSHFVYPSMDEPLNCLHILAIVNMLLWTNVQISVPDLTFNSFRCRPRNRITESHGNSMFYFLRNHHTLVNRGCTLFHLH